MAEKCFMENYFAEKWANVLLKKWWSGAMECQTEKEIKVNDALELVLWTTDTE